MHGFGCRLLIQNAARFLMDDIYRNPGPLQFEGPGSDAKAITVCVEDRDYMGRIKSLQDYLEKVNNSLLLIDYRSHLFAQFVFGICWIRDLLC